MAEYENDRRGRQYGLGLQWDKEYNLKNSTSFHASLISSHRDRQMKIGKRKFVRALTKWRMTESVTTLRRARGETMSNPDSRIAGGQ